MKLKSSPTIHPDEEALLRSVIEETDDSVPRLVMADWYEENGQQERAEFIRVQIELEQMKESDPKRAEWMLREKRLLRENRLQWTEELDDRWFNRERHPLSRFVTDIPSGCRFRRGFVESLKLKDLDTFLHYAKNIYQSIPLQVLAFQESPRSFDDYQALLYSPYFSRLREVSFGDICEPVPGIHPLFSHPALQALRVLRIGFLGSMELRHHGLRGLAESSTLTSLIELDIRSNLEVRELMLFSSPTSLLQLKRLALPDVWLDEKKVHLLTNSPKFQKLERLELNYRMFAKELQPLEEARLKSRLDTTFGDRLRWAMQYGGRRVVIG